MSVLLSQEKIPKTIVDSCVRMAESVADELTRADGREVRILKDFLLKLLHFFLLFSKGLLGRVSGLTIGLIDTRRWI